MYKYSTDAGRAVTETVSTKFKCRMVNLSLKEMSGRIDCFGVCVGIVCLFFMCD